MANERFLLKNVRPIGFPDCDPGKPLDVLIKSGEIETAGRFDAPADAEATDFGGAYLSPAWVDMHTHVYWGCTDISAWPGDVGIATGVPIVVDAGSAGEGNFEGMKEFIIKPAREKVIPFLNVGSIGLTATNRVPEVRFMRDIDLDRVVRTVSTHMNLIVGLKLRMCSIIDAETDILPLKLAKKLSRVLKVPLMVHVGLSLPLIEEVLNRLDEGDILTHCFHGKPASSIIDEPVAGEATRRAKRRGVVFDIGHGSASFSYRVARMALDQGIRPDTISTDSYKANLDGPVWDLSVVMSKLMAVGLTLEETVRGVTAAPRRALGMAEAELRSSAEASFTIFTVEDCDLSLPDSLGDAMPIRKRIRPRAVFWRSELTEAASRLE